MGPAERVPAPEIEAVRRLLQWGRPVQGRKGQDAVATWMRLPRLQWGRPCSGAERTSSGSMVPQSPSCFNGAVTLQTGSSGGTFSLLARSDRDPG